MDREKLTEIIKGFDTDVDYINGMVLFNIRTGEQIVTTYEPKVAANAIEVEQLIEKLKVERLDKLQPESRYTWGMTSFERVIYTSLRIRGDMVIAIEFDSKKSPTDAIEDLLEIGIDLGHYL